MIDSIICRDLRAVTDDGSVFEKTNQSSKTKCRGEPKLQFVNMEEPCYNLPTECPSGPPLLADAVGSDVDSDDVVDDIVDVDDDGDDDEVEGGDEDAAEGGDDDSIDSENVLVKRHQKHKKKSHHGKKKSKGGKKQKHPWAGLCVGSGSFCGSNLFGCDFIPSAVYTCSQHAGKPTFVKVCSNGCDKGACNGDDAVVSTTTAPVVVPSRTTEGPRKTDKPLATTDGGTAIHP